MTNDEAVTGTATGTQASDRQPAGSGASDGALRLLNELADDDALRADPHSVYRALRAQGGPVVAAPERNEVMLLDYDVSLAVLRDPRCSTNPSHRIRPPGEEDADDFRVAMTSGNSRVLLFLDPPDHTRLRRLVSKAFTPRAVERLRPHIAEIVDGILDDAADAGEFDVVEDLGYRLAVTVICELMGVPTSDRHLFGPWSSAASRLLDGATITAEELQASVEGAVALSTYFEDLFVERRRSPGEDLVSALLAVEEEGDRLTPDELRSIVVLLFIAGHETTMNLIGNGTLALLRHPDQLALLAADPELAPSAVEELLRFDGPVQLTGRIPTCDVEIEGYRFDRGTQLTVMLMAANRDPARFDDPDRLDITRTDNAHLSFSGGMHYCLGASLARVEAQVAVGKLTDRFGDVLELRTDDVRFREHVVLRGLTELRVATR
ncbi:MAG: cytochrome P450 [Acidimicrobiia bacterium]|nr:cytochrome P450 [Acidimicrobiia bacterium]